MDYIDRKKLLDRKRRMKGFGISPEDDFGDYAVLCEDIKNAPSENVAPVVNAVWTDMRKTDKFNEYSFKCSNCGRRIRTIYTGKLRLIIDFPYCHCGAKMYFEE